MNLGNDLYINGKFNMSGILRYANHLAKSNRAQFGGLPWDLELKQALLKSWARARALRLRAVGVEAA